MPALVILLFIVMFVFSIVMWIRRMSIAQDRVDQWAQQNGYEIISRQRRTMFRGPFWLTTSKSQEVYEITVRDRDGNQREGYVRVGGMFLGMMSDNLEVRWKDQG